MWCTRGVATLKRVSGHLERAFEAPKASIRIC